MNTNVFIDMVLMSVPSATRSSVLNVINFAIGFIIDRPLAIMRYKDPTTGVDPILTTTAGVYQYQLSSGSTGWSGPNTSFVSGVSEDYEDYSDSLIYSTAFNAGTGSTIITFKEDPGASSYYVETYQKPAVLGAETSNSGIIPFPDNLIHHLMELVVSIIERSFHGQSARYDEFVNNTIQMVRGQVNETNNFVKYSNERWY